MLNNYKSNFLNKEIVYVIFTCWILYLLKSPIGKVFFYEYIPYASAFKFEGLFNIDPLLSVVFIKTLPVIFKLFYSIYDIPLVHLITGILLKLGIIVSLFKVIRLFTKDYFVAFLSIVFFIGLLPYFNINKALPIGIMSNEIRGDIYFSFRQLGLIFSLNAFCLHWRGNYFLSSLILIAGFYIHPINQVVFFLCLTLSNILNHLMEKNFKVLLSYFLYFILPFLLGVIPFKLSIDSVFLDIIPISFDEHWNFIMKNEPDDISILYNLKLHAKDYIVSFLISLVSSVYILKYSQKNSRNSFLDSLTSRKVLIFVLVPWVFILFGILWEWLFIPILPDKLNDIFTSLMFRRYSAVSAFLYVPIFSSILLSIYKKCYSYISTKVFFLESLNKSLTSKDLLKIMNVFVLVSGLLIYVTSKQKDFLSKKNFISIRHEAPEFFIYQDDDINLQYAYNDNGFNPEFSISSLIDVCKYVRKNIAVSDALIVPPYIREFRALSERQIFISEKLDGNNAPHKRKYATLYLERFRMITKGLSYDDFNGIVFGGGKEYAKMRNRFLSLTKNEIEIISNKFPGHKYLVTEKSHFMNKEVVYENENFKIYKI